MRIKLDIAAKVLSILIDRPIYLSIYLSIPIYQSSVCASYNPLLQMMRHWPRNSSFFCWQKPGPGLSQASWGATWLQVWGWTVAWAESQTEHSLNLLNSQEHALLLTSPGYLLLLCQLPAPHGPILSHMASILICNITSSFSSIQGPFWNGPYTLGLFTIF